MESSHPAGIRPGGSVSRAIDTAFVLRGIPFREPGMYNSRAGGRRQSGELGAVGRGEVRVASSGPEDGGYRARPPEKPVRRADWSERRRSPSAHLRWTVPRGTRTSRPGSGPRDSWQVRPGRCRRSKGRSFRPARWNWNSPSRSTRRSTRARAFAVAMQLVAGAFACDPSLGLTYDAARSRVEDGRVVIVLTAPARAGRGGPTGEDCGRDPEDSGRGWRGRPEQGAGAHGRHDPVRGARNVQSDR